MELRNTLISASNEEIGSALSAIYSDIIEHYVLRRWKSAGLDAGHFVEAARRFVELKLFGLATPIGKGLPSFNEAVLKGYLNAQGNESYRVLIPRTLWALFALRNKRSIGHLGAVAATELDASLLLNGAKWILAEIIRLESNLNADETTKLVADVIARQQPVIWREGNITRVLDSSMDPRQRALVLLAFVGPHSETDLRAAVRHKDPSNFRKILKRMDDANFISYEPAECRISPKGTEAAEALIAGR